MKVHLKYGKTGLVVDLPDKYVTVIEPEFIPGLSEATQKMNWSRCSLQQFCQDDIQEKNHVHLY